MVRFHIAVIGLLLLAACAPTAQHALERQEVVQLFLAMAPDAAYAEVAAPADIAAAECPNGNASTRSVYTTEGASLVVYSTEGDIACALFKQDDLVPVRKPLDEAPEGVVLEVNGVPVTEGQARAAIDGATDPATIEAALQRLINDELLRQEAARVTVTEEQVAAALDALRQADPAATEEAAMAQARLAVLLGARLRIGEINVTEEVAKEFYLANPDAFIVPEQAVMRHLFVRGQGRTQEQVTARVQEIVSKIPSEDFCDLVREYSDDKKEECGTFVVPRGVIVPELERAAFGTPQGQTAVVQLEDGAHFVQTAQVLGTRVMPFEDVSGQIGSSLANEVFQRRLALYLSMLRARAAIVVYSE